MCTDDHILLFHTQSHLNKLKNLFAASEQCDGDKNKKRNSKSNNNNIQYIDEDTKIMTHTRNAAYRAVGAVIAAVDSVLNKSSVDKIELNYIYLNS